MAAEGLPFTRRTKTYNSRPGQELAKWAETKPEGQGIHYALFRPTSSTAEHRQSGGPGRARRAGRACRGRSPQSARRTELLPGRRPRLGTLARAGSDRRANLRDRRFGAVGAQPYEEMERLVRHVGAVPVVGGEPV